MSRTKQASNRGRSINAKETRQRDESPTRGSDAQSSKAEQNRASGDRHSALHAHLRSVCRCPLRSLFVASLCPSLIVTSSLPLPALLVTLLLAAPAASLSPSSLRCSPQRSAAASFPRCDRSAASSSADSIVACIVAASPLQLNRAAHSRLHARLFFSLLAAVDV